MGRVGIFVSNKEFDKVVADSHVTVVRFSSSFNSGFAHIWFNSPYIQSDVESKASGSTNQIEWNLASIQSEALPLPPLAEQKRIVARVDSLFALIDQLSQQYTAEQAERSKLVASSLARLARGDSTAEQNLALTHLGEVIRTKADAKVLRQTILHLAVSGQLVPQDPSEGTGEQLYQQIQAEKQKLIAEGKIKKRKPLPEISDDEIPFEIPDNWKWARLANTVTFSIGRTPSRSDSSFWSDSYMPWVSIADLRANEHIDSTKEWVSKKAFEKSFGGISVPSGSLLYSFKLTIGKMSILDMDAVHNEAIASFTTFDDILTQYLFKALSVIDPLKNTNQAVMGKTLNSQSLSLLEIPLPPLAEQKRIIAKTTQLLDLVAELETHLEM